MGKDKKQVPIIDPGAKKWLLGIGILVIAVIVFLVFSFNNAGAKYEEFAQCLTDSGVKMYGAYWCGACESQKRQFGKSFSNVNYVECELPNRGGTTQICNDEGIERFPTWEFADGTKLEGVLSFQQLSEISGCSLSV